MHFTRVELILMKDLSNGTLIIIYDFHLTVEKMDDWKNTSTFSDIDIINWIKLFSRWYFLSLIAIRERAITE